MNRLFQISTPIPHPYNLLISTFLRNRYKLPRLTKSIIVKNTINVTHEELRAAIQSLPLYRIFASHFIKIIGTFDIIENRSEYKAMEDIMVVCNITHNPQKISGSKAESHSRIITLKDFDYYYIADGKYHKHEPDSDLEQTFFHVLDPVVTNKRSPVELSFVAFSNWTELTGQFLSDNFLSLFDETGKQIALTEYQHISPYFKNISCPVINCWSTGARPDNVVHIRFDYLDTLEQSYKDLFDWMLEDLRQYIKSYVNVIPVLIPEGKIELIKDETFSNYIMYAILVNQGIDCVNNTINYIRSIKIDTQSFFDNLDKNINALKDNINKSLSNN